jgi:hypothetical protein
LGSNLRRIEMYLRDFFNDPEDIPNLRKLGRYEDPYKR